MNRPALRSAILPATLCVAGIITILYALFLANPLAVKRLNDLAYDILMTTGKKREPHPKPIIIEIDEKSLSEIGQWPWPRDIMADLLDRLLQAGAAAIGVDALFREQDRTSPAWLRQRLAERYGADLNLDSLPASALDNDEYLKQMLTGRPVVIGAFADFDAEPATDQILPKTIGVGEKAPHGAPRPADTLARAGAMLMPLQIFHEAAPVGLLNTAMQSDGTVRSTPLLVRIGDRIFPSLSLRTFMASINRSTLRLDSNEDGLSAFTVGKFRVPVDHTGAFQPVYRGPGRTFPYFSAADILAGRISPDEIRGKIAFIGATATGLGDLRATPFDPVVPGVEIHATITDNILTGASIVRPAWNPGAQISAIVVLTIVPALLFGLAPAIWAIGSGLALLAACLWLAWFLFQKGLFVSPVFAIAALLLTGAVFLPWRFWAESAAKKKLRQAFSLYVSPKIVRNIVNQGMNPLAGEKKEVSILFTDVRGFTTISEQLSSGELVRLLNSYFTPMTKCVTSRDGTLDKFIGDALMAFWNAPVNVRDHQLKAVEAALEMQTRLTALADTFRQQFGVEMRMGAGIHCGEARVGNMGSTDLLDYTCIGRNVNMASRLEGLCKYYGMGIIASDPVAAACAGRINFVFIDTVKVKGSDEPMKVHAPLQAGEEPEATILGVWQEAQNNYQAGNFRAALNLFATTRNVDLLATAASVFVNRCNMLLQRPPSNWHGVWKHDSK